MVAMEENSYELEAVRFSLQSAVRCARAVWDVECCVVRALRGVRRGRMRLFRVR